jgi:CubicO group peptidase (beta-lactamase class C family)
VTSVLPVSSIEKDLMKKRNNNFLRVIAATLLILSPFYHATVMAQPGNVDIFLQQKMKELRIPGMQVAVVQNGEIIFSKSYGYANLQDSVPVNNKSVFSINSCTKAFTGVAIMQLVEEGKVDLDAPVSRYVDNLPAAWQAVTIKQLLIHVSGLPEILHFFDPVTHGLGKQTEDIVWEKVKAQPMQFKTGGQFSYNQTNYVLLGKVIERLTGKPFAQIFQEKQFQIAGIQRTLFGDSRDVIPRFAPTYRYLQAGDGEGKYTANYTEFPFFQRTGSGLNSTAEDMANWIIALQQGKLLKSKTSLTTLWKQGTYNDGTPTQWALGFGITKPSRKHPAVGMSGGGRSAFLIYPEDKLAVVVLTNLGGSSPENFITELAGYFNPDISASDPLTALRIHLVKRGFQNTMQVYSELKKKDPEFKPNEYEMNDWGYRLMSNGQIKEAQAVFKLNVFIYPESWNVYDSYGESLLKDGQKEEAVAMYKKSLELNPDNEGGKRVLEKILK